MPNAYCMGFLKGKHLNIIRNRRIKKLFKHKIFTEINQTTIPPERKTLPKKRREGNGKQQQKDFGGAIKKADFFSPEIEIHSHSRYSCAPLLSNPAIHQGEICTQK